MRGFFYTSVIVLLLSILSLEGYLTYTLLKGKEEKKETPRVKTSYEIILRGDGNLAQLLLEKGLAFSYKKGDIEIKVENPQRLEEILKLYSHYLEEKKRLEKASFAIRSLIKEDIKLVEDKLSHLRKEYGELKGLLTSRGINVSYSPFLADITELQRKVFLSYTFYWDSKLKQLLGGFKNPVNEPSVDIKKLLQRASIFYGDDLKLRLFRLYLNIKIYESRLEADLVKYREYELEGGG
jgi:hypothetical protein